MILAIPYANGQIFQHFGHTEQFKLYEIQDGAVVNTAIRSTDGQGHGALASWLSAQQVDAVICGGIGGGAQTALKQANIQVYGGVSGAADRAAQDLAEGRLVYNPFAQCAHHGSAHTCGGHHGEGHSCHHE